jgi:hypothetical protein
VVVRETLVVSTWRRVFGLSMDYEVFLLSRVREEYDRTGDNNTAVADPRDRVPRSGAGRHVRLSGRARRLIPTQSQLDAEAGGTRGRAAAESTKTLARVPRPPRDRSLKPLPEG